MKQIFGPTFPVDLKNLFRRLAKSRDFGEVKAIRDEAERARFYARSARFSLKHRNRAAELMLRAQRRAGEMLAELVPHGGDRKSSDRDGNLSLAGLGIDRNQSARWRREASIPLKVFNDYLASAYAGGEQITSRGLLRWTARKNVRRKKAVRIRRAQPQNATAIVSALKYHCNLLSHLNGEEYGRKRTARLMMQLETTITALERSLLKN